MDNITKKWTRACVKPANIGWYERKYPLIAGQHQHPCLFDFWNGVAWLGGFPDKQGDVLTTGHTVQAATIANDQHLPWRNLPGRRYHFSKNGKGTARMATAA